MAQFFQIVQNVDELKRICPNLNLENVQVVSMGAEDVGLNSQQLIITQDDSLVLNDNQVPQIVYQQQQSQQPNQAQQTPTHYIIQQDDDSETSMSQQQIFYSTDLEGDQLVQQHQMVQQPQSQVVLRHITTSSQQQQQHQQQQHQQQQPLLVQKTSDSDLRQAVPTQVLMPPTNQTSTPQHVIVQQPTQHVVLQPQHQTTGIQQQNAQPQQQNQPQQQQQQIVMRHQIPAASLGQPRIIYTQPRTVVFTHQLTQQQLQQHQMQQQSIQHPQSQSTQQESQSPQQESVKASPQHRSVQQRQSTVQTAMPNIIFTPVQQQHPRQQVTSQSTSQTTQDTLQQPNQQIQHSTFLPARASQVVRNPAINRNQASPSPRISVQSRPNIRLNLIQNSSIQTPNNATTANVAQTQPPTISQNKSRARTNTNARGRGGRGRGALTTPIKSTPHLVAPQPSPNKQVNSPALPPQSTIPQQQSQPQSQQPASISSQHNTQKIYQTHTSNAVLQQHRLIASQVQQRIIGQQIQRPSTSSSVHLATSTGVQTPQPKFRSPLSVSKTVGTNFQGSVDLEDSIRAVVVSKNTDTTTTATSTSTHDHKTIDTTLTTYYTERCDEDKKSSKLTNGRVMTLFDYKRLRQPPPVRTLATTRTTNSTIPVNRVTPMPITTPTTSKPQASSQTTTITVNEDNRTVRTQTQNAVQPQHVIQAQNRNQLQIQEGDTQKSARMLVVLSTGEQRLITFTLPKESCTVQELLEQVGVPFTPETSIQCVPNPGANIDYVVTVGLSAQESTSELISAAEQSLQQQKTESQQQESSMDKLDSAQLAQPQTITVHVDRSSNTAEIKDVPAKFIQGFLAVCQFCGYSGCDHAKCERCKRVFQEEPKRIPCSKSVTKSKEEEIKRQNLQAELFNKAATKAFATIAAHRGRGTVAAVRGRAKTVSRTRPAEVEPVILTLSSDDEGDDEKSNQSLKIPPDTTIIIQKPPLPFEPVIEEEDDQRYPYTNRENVADISNCIDKLQTTITCKVVRIGTHRYEPKEEVLFTTKGVRIIAPNCNNLNEKVVLHIQANEIVKLIAHFPKVLTVLFIYTLPRCGQYIRESLEMKPKNISAETPYYNPTDRSEPYKRIVLQVDNMSEQSKSVIKSIFATQVLEEISLNDANELLLRSCSKDKAIKSDASSTGNVVTETENIRQILIYPPGKGGISINTEDYMCLAIDQYLNDVIIDFYLKYLHLNLLNEEQRHKTHIFSSFFYKRLTTMTARQRQTEKDAKLTASQKRHARVKNWTKNVNIFEKDFIIIPIVEQSHWFLAIICYPRLKGPVSFDTLQPVVPQQISKKKKVHTERKVSLQIGNTTITPLSKRELESVCVGDDGESERDEAEGDESDLMSEDSDTEGNNSGNCEEHQPIKQPCILIFDSLSGASRNRVVATLRDYLTCEYKLRVKDDSTVFTKLHMPGHCVKVPQQNNFTDCGLYLLQYVEHFFKDPIRDYHLPIKQLVNWFETIVVTRKREEISNLLRELVEQLNPDKLPLPEITFPTINGKLVEQDDSFNDEQAEFEEEEMEEELEEEEDEEFGMDTEGEGSPEKMQNGNSERREILKRSLDDIGRVHDPIRKAARLDHTT